MKKIIILTILALLIFSFYEVFAQNNSNFNDSLQHQNYTGKEGPENVLADYYQPYGQSLTQNIYLTPSTKNFEVDGIAILKTAKWYVNGILKETDHSGLFAIDPDFTWTFSNGTTEIKALIYDINDIYEESHIWNVTVQKPDLIVQSIATSPSNPVIGDKFAVKVIIKNQGDATAYLGLFNDINCFLYVDGTKYTLNYDNLSRGQTVTLNQNNLTTPNKTSFTISADADGNNEVDESNPNNNTKSIIVYTQEPPKPDLIVQNITTSPSNPVRDGNFDVNVVIKNQGNATAYLGLFNDINCFLYVDGTRYTLNYDNLGPGETVSLPKNNLTVPDKSTFTISADADGNNEVDESDPNNNTKSITIYTQSQEADLAVSNLSFLPQTINFSDHPSSVSFHLTNNGPADLAFPNTKIKANFYISSNTSFGDEDDIYIGNNTYDVTLSSVSSTTITLSSGGLSYLTIPSNVSGNYYVFLEIEHYTPSTLTDLNPSNNYTMTSGTIYIRGNEADLAASNLSFLPQTINPGNHPSVSSIL